MNRCLVIGRANVGKTLFTINFAAFLGGRDLVIGFQASDGRVNARYSRAEAVERLVSSTPHTTRCLNQVPVEMDVGKGSQRFELVDTAGLSDQVLEDVALRSAMAQTLSALREGGIILHLVDASQAALPEPDRGIGEVDRQLARYGGAVGRYVVLANKMDLPGARAGLTVIRGAFPERHIIPISALRQDGFKEVRSFVRRAL